jgi:ABC-type Fe3+ transport system permease subunit
LNYFRKLHNRREPPGLERKILRRLPMALLGSTLVPVMMAVGGRWNPPDGTREEIYKYTSSVDIFAISLGLTLWTAVFTVAIGCIVVVVMKGPAYVADEYPFEGRPQRKRTEKDET